MSCTECYMLYGKHQAHCPCYQTVEKAATDLFDNRLGWSDGRNPYAPPSFWDKLEEALKELKKTEQDK